MTLVSLIPPEVTSAVLTALGIGGAWLATLLARRGKKEDTRIGERQQAFQEILDLAASRLSEIARLITERDAAKDRGEKIAASWETRWDRQMERCRNITEPLVATIQELRKGCTAEAEAHADTVLRQLSAHNERDHAPDIED